MVHHEERQRNGMNLGLGRFGPGKHDQWHPRSNDDAAGLAPGKIRNCPIQDIGRLDVGAMNTSVASTTGLSMHLRSAANRLRGTSRAKGPSR